MKVLIISWKILWHFAVWVAILMVLMQPEEKVDVLIVALVVLALLFITSSWRMNAAMEIASIRRFQHLRVKLGEQVDDLEREALDESDPNKKPGYWVHHLFAWLAAMSALARIAWTVLS
jgi:hypothetical protein